MRGCKAANYSRIASVCEGQELGGAKAPPSLPGSAALAGVCIKYPCICDIKMYMNRGMGTKFIVYTV